MDPFLDSTAVQDDGPELHKRMERDGYLFVRGLLPGNLLENLRLQLLQIAADGGWVDTKAPLGEAIAQPNGFCVEPTPEYMDVYHKMYALPQFHSIQHRPELVQLVERMCGEAVFPHARIIGRTIFPQYEEFTTPPHQDFVPIQGSADTYSAWFPLHDLPTELGGLAVSTGSHRKGVLEFRPSLGAGGMEITDPLEGTWVNGPFGRGDVLFFHSMCVHQGTPNVGRSLRMSVDARYQRLSDPVHEASLEPHIRPVGWDQVYADWSTEFDYLQYYWRDWKLNFSEYDFSYLEERDRLAFEMAAVGDERARSTLQRIIARDEDPAKRTRASQMLERLDETTV
jgi:hypothetical protein